jgi:hypothetical protein
MNANRKLVWMILMLVVVAVALSTGVEAKDSGKVSLKRAASDLKVGGSGPTSFGEAAQAKDMCSGWCNCSYCECSGGLSCCIGGCEACWDYRDDQGYCGPAT